MRFCLSIDGILEVWYSEYSLF